MPKKQTKEQISLTNEERKLVASALKLLRANTFRSEVKDQIRKLLRKFEA